MDSVMMPQEGPPLDDYKADPSPVSVDKDEPPQKKPNIRKRTKTGCLTCRKRRIKCDEGKPICNNCIKSKRQCEGYNTRVIFKNPMGALPGGPFGPLPYHHPDPTEALVNAQFSSAHSKASSSSQGPLPIIAPKPPSLDYGNATHFSYMGAYPGVHRANSTAGLGFDGLGVHNSQYVLNAMSPESMYSQPLPPPPPLHLGLHTSSTQMHHPDLFDFPIPDQSPLPRSNTGLVLPERRHTAYAILERPTMSPTTLEFTPPISHHGPPPNNMEEALEAVNIWDVEEENNTLEYDDEENLDLDLAGPGTDISMTAVGRLHGTLDFYGTSVRSFQALSGENVLANYTPSPKDSPLNDPKVAAIFWYFLHVTGPALNMYERNRPDPSRIFSGEAVPRSDQHIWTYTFPTQSMKHPALLHAILALGSLQMAEYQGQSPTVSMLHYHICIRRSAKNYQKSGRRTQPATLAAVLLLGFYEVWSTNHEKWCSHMLGAMVIIKETMFLEMSRRVMARHQQRYQDWLGLQAQDPFAAFLPQAGQYPSHELAEIDLGLVRRLSGKPILFLEDGLEDAPSWHSGPSDRDLEDYEHLADLYWWFCKMDVYQSTLGGSKLFLDYDLWTQCPPRAPINRINQIYGTFDHLVLILGRLSDFVAKDLTRKRRARERGASASPKGQTSPPMFAGMFPGRGNIRMPRGLDDPQGANNNNDAAENNTNNNTTNNNNTTSFSEDADDLDACTSRAMDEWERILHVFELFKRSLGPGFDPMGADVHPPQDSPFGPALTYRTYGIAGIWMNFYMGLVVLHRAHPTMPPFAMMAAHQVARQTEPYANEIGKIVAGMAEDMTAETTISTMVGAAYIECCFPLFVGAVQFRDKLQRKWAIRRLHDITRLTGWKTSDQIASGCEAAWRKAAEMGVAPEYEPESSDFESFSTSSSSSSSMSAAAARTRAAAHHNLSNGNGGYTTAATSRRIDNRIQEIDEGQSGSVLQRSDRAYVAFGLLSIDADLEKLSLED